MRSIHRMISGTKRAVNGIAVAGLLVLGSTAEAAPILGAQLFWQGGDVSVTVRAATAGITSQLRLYSTNPDIFVAFNSNGTPAGTVVTLSAAQLDVDHDIGDELVFGIDSPGQGVFKLGPAARNPDNIIHGAIDDLGGGLFRVGFEDLLGGGDRDYDDNVFDFRGSIATTPTTSVPEPSLILLLGLGLAGLGIVRRC